MKKYVIFFGMLFFSGMRAQDDSSLMSENPKRAEVHVVQQSKLTLEQRIDQLEKQVSTLQEQDEVLCNACMHQAGAEGAVQHCLQEFADDIEELHECIEDLEDDIDFLHDCIKDGTYKKSDRVD